MGLQPGLISRKYTLYFGIFICCMVFALSAQANEKRVALLIGNSSYNAPDSNIDLDNPKNDVNDYAKTLRTLGFETKVYHNLNRGQMSKVITAFGDQYGDDDGIFVLYFAGHGNAVGGVNYMLPIITASDNPDDIATLGLDANEMLKRFSAGQEGRKGRINVAILDMCRVLPLKKNRGSTGLAPMTASGGNLIAFSTATGTLASDGKGKNSPYAQALIEVAQEKNLSLNDYFGKVRERVGALTKGDQIPEESSRILGVSPIFTQYAPNSQADTNTQTQQLVRLQQENEQLRRQQAASQASSNTLAMASPSPAAQATTLPLIANRYRDNQDGTITDTQTKLQWKRCSEGQSWTGSRCTGEAGQYKWEKARKLTSNFADKTDWRLPTIAELNTLVYCSNGKQRKFKESGYETIKHEGHDGCASNTRGDYRRPTIDTQAFPNTPVNKFWSASPDAADTGFAWVVIFYYGYDFWFDKNYDISVRLVRGQ